MRSVATNTLPQEMSERSGDVFPARVFLNTFFAPKKSIEEKFKKISYLCKMRKMVVIVFWCFSTVLSAQIIPDGQGGFIVPAVIRDGDTIIFIHLPEFETVSKQIFKNKRQEEAYRRLVHNVRKVYPYAKLAGEVYRHYDSILHQETNERKKANLMKDAERDIKKQFESELRNLTISQGKILVLLLDRETSHTAFNLVKDLRNTFQAYLWQGVGRLFGYNLRTKYDPNKTHADIESIVRLIERGQLSPIPIPVKEPKPTRQRR